MSVKCAEWGLGDEIIGSCMKNAILLLAKELIYLSDLKNLFFHKNVVKRGWCTFKRLVFVKNHFLKLRWMK